MAKPPFATNATGVVAHLMPTGSTASPLRTSPRRRASTTSSRRGACSSPPSPPTAQSRPARGVPANAKATIKTEGGNQVFTVPFTGDLSKCAYTASPTDVRASTVAVGSGTDKSTVVVTEQGATRYGFHLQVTC